MEGVRAQKHYLNPRPWDKYVAKNEFFS
jgi:hypothetical protein